MILKLRVSEGLHDAMDLHPVGAGEGWEGGQTALFG